MDAGKPQGRPRARTSPGADTVPTLRATEDLPVDRPGFDPEEADLDRTPEEAAERSPEVADESPEGAAMRVELE
jgi:hypothetical protein